MAIVTQHIPVHIKGLNEKKDDAVSIPGELVTAQNVDQAATGALKVRNGSSSLGTPANAELLFTRNGQLCSAGYYGPVAHNSRGGNWVTTNFSTIWKPSTVDVHDVFASVSTQAPGCSVYVDGYVYTTTQAGLVITEYWTKNLVLSQNHSVIGERGERVGTAGTSVVFFRLTGNTLQACMATPSSGTYSPGAFVTVATDVKAGSGSWDVCQVRGDASGRILVAYLVNGSPTQLKTLYWTAANAADATVGVVTHTASGTTALHIAIADKQIASGFLSTGHVYLATQTNNPGVEHIRGLRLDAATLASVTNTIVHTTINTFQPGIVCAYWNSNEKMYIHWIDRSGSGYQLAGLYWDFAFAFPIMGTAASDLSAPAIDKLGPRPFFVYGDGNSDLCLGCFSTTDPTQPVMFIVNYQGYPVARVLAGTADSCVIGTGSSSIGDTTRTVHLFSVTRSYQLQKNDTTLTYNRGVAVVRVELPTRTNTALLSHDLAAPISVGSGAVGPGGITAAIAIDAAPEANFLKFPYIISVSVGAVAAASHQYVAVYEWIDTGGNLHRSAPSAVFTVSNSSATPNNTVELERFTTTTKHRATGFSVALYRTAAGGTEFRRVTSIATPSMMTPAFGSTTLSIVDTVTDTTLATRDLIYTTGGIFESMPPPSSRHAALHDNRVFLFGCERGNEVWFSKQLVTGEAPAFNDAFVIHVDGSDGLGTTAGASLENALAVFKPRAIYAVTGAGPDDLGRGAYDVPRKISDTIGTSRPRSVVNTKDGVFFQATDGRIFLLTQGMELVHIGQPIEDTAIASTVVGGGVIPATGEVKLACADGKVLVYDPQHGQWYIHVYSGRTFSSACAWNGALVTQIPHSLVLKETAATYTDGGTAITAKIKTSPLALAGLENLQRIREVIIHGTAASAGTVVTVRLYYDYSSTVGESFTYTTVTGRNAIRLQPKIQKCAAIAIEVEQTAAASSLAVSGFTLGVAVKGRGTTSGSSATPV